MSYMALYRKWRPDAFEEVKGQEHIVTTLKNQLTHDRIGHAYIFCGTRGTGKTTVAKLFAKSVNCEHPIDGSPCGECASCKAIAAGSSMDVMEIDAASNNGIDSIRQIRDEVQYAPTIGKYKVYIIDEAHQITPQAFNALLKTLEEPPSYVIFIFATTDVHKIPITIASRCQRYDFRRISIETISTRLEDLLNREGISAEKKALDYIAKMGDGSMRDALSLLDKCISFYLGETLTYEKCLEILGAVDIDIFMQLLTCVEEKNVTAAIDLIDEIMWQGMDISQFITDFIWFLRNMMLLKSTKESKDRLDLSQDNLDKMEAMTEKMEMNTILRYIRIFTDLQGTARYSSQKRVLLELTIIKLCTPAMEQDYSSIVQRLDDLTKDIEKIKANPTVFAANSATGNGANQGANPGVNQDPNMAGNASQTGDNLDALSPEERKRRLEKLRASLPKATNEDIQSVVDHKSEIIGRLGGGIRTALQWVGFRLDPDNTELAIVLDDAQGSMFDGPEGEENQNEVSNTIAEFTGRNIKVSFYKKNQMNVETEKVYPIDFFGEKGVSFGYDEE